MNYAELFKQIDAKEGPTMLVFDDIETANNYAFYRRAQGAFGIIARREDTRTGSGLVVQWRDPVPFAELSQRMAEALWLLEEVLAGRLPRPQPGVVDFTPEMQARAATDRADA